MEYTAIYTLILAGTSLFAFVLCLINLLKGKRGIFYSFVVIGFLGISLGYFYTFLLESTGKSGMVFNIGSLGIISGYLCISFACKSITKVDLCEVNSIKKYKILSSISVLIFVILWIFLLTQNVGMEKMVIATLLLFSAMPCAYYCLLNILIPYPKKSINRCLMPFFIVNLICSLLSMITETVWGISNYSEVLATTISIICLNSTAVCYLLIPILLVGGYKRWKRM